MTRRTEPAEFQLGDPLREQRELSEGRAVAVLPPRGVVFLGGDDAAEFLRRMLSRTPSSEPGASCESLVLDPSGHIRFVLQCMTVSNGFLLMLSTGLEAAFVEWVQSMRFRMRVDVRVRSEDFCEVAWCGTPAWAEQLGTSAVWADPWGHIEPGGWRSTANDLVSADGWVLRVGLLPAERLSAACAAAAEAGAGRAGWGAVDALRIAVGRPTQETEVDERTIPHELDWLRTAVQLDKGCYPGQETVSKVHNLGHPPRRLVLLQLDGAPDIPRGAEVRLGDRVVGRVTASAVHWEMGPIALAVLKRSTPVADDVLVQDGDQWVSAAQEPVVSAEAGGVARAPVQAFRAARRGRMDRPVH